MPKIPTAGIASAGLVGGYVVARKTRVRPLGAVPLLAGGAACGRRWTKAGGGRLAAILLGTYFGGFAAAHPLAKRIGAWPAVLSVAAASAAASWVLADRHQ